MAQLVFGGTHEFDAIASGMPTYNTLAYMENKLTNGLQYVNEMGRAFLQRGVELFEEYTSSDMMARAKLAISKVASAFDLDVVRPLWDVTEFQNSKPMMQRYLMADPYVRQMYFDQRIDGWQGSYVNHYGSDIGWMHRDYRQVFDGVMQECPDDPELDWVIECYFDEPEKNETEFTLKDQVTIITAMDRLRSLLKEGKQDPTNPEGGYL